MSLFKTADEVAYLKAGFFGEAGSGKTHTATLLATGLVDLLRRRNIGAGGRPAYMVDSETGSAWVKPLFDEAGIELRVARTRAFADLVPAIEEAQRNGSVLLIDSVTHFWEELKAEYIKAKSQRLSERYKREIVADLEFQDWAYLKSTWAKFTDAFVNSPLHIIICGRQGWEYENVVNESTGKRQIERSSVKMAAEKGLGYEPNLLVWMTRDLDLKTKETIRTASVIKDRSRRLDGQEFPNPTFKTFASHVLAMNLGGNHDVVDLSRTSAALVPDLENGPQDFRSIRRDIVLEEIQALMVKHYPSTSAADKAAKAALLVDHFKTTSWTFVEKLMRLEDLQSSFDAMHVALEKKPSHYGFKAQPKGPVDEIPALAATEAPAQAPATTPDRAQAPAAVATSVASPEPAQAPATATTERKPEEHRIEISAGPRSGTWALSYDGETIAPSTRTPEASAARALHSLGKTGFAVFYDAASDKPRMRVKIEAQPMPATEPAITVVRDDDAGYPDEAIAAIEQEFAGASTTAGVLSIWRKYRYNVAKADASTQKRIGKIRDAALVRVDGPMIDAAE